MHDATIPAPGNGSDAEGGGRALSLQRDALGVADILGVSLADTAPAMSFFFSFAAIEAAAGLASPIAIVVAAIAVLLKINSLVEFTRVTPSAGSYISYIRAAFGRKAGVVTAWALGFGYIVAVGYVMAVMGGFMSQVLQQFVHVRVPWQPIAIVFVLFVSYLVYRGVTISARWASASFAFELALILVAMVAIVVHDHQHLSFASFNPARLPHGLSSLGLAFPLAVFLFIGVGNPGAMVEETRDARRNVPRAIYIAVISVTILYILMAWTTSIAFHDQPTTIANLAAPFVTAATRALGPFAILVYLAGLTSTFSSLLGATTAQTRILFSAGRDALLPRFLARLSPRYRTPVAALAVYWIGSGVMTLIWGSTGNPLVVAGDIATLGTIPIALTYLALNVALPVYYFRFHRDKLVWGRHVVVPVLGIVALLLPLWGLVKPGQPYPFDIFPYIALAVIAVGIVASLLTGRGTAVDPSRVAFEEGD
jgi:amino acid transporter